MNLFRITFFFILAQLFTSSAIAQLLNYNIESEQWFPGVIQLADGKMLTGKVNYNFVVGTLKFENGGEPQTFAPRSVSRFTMQTGKAKRMYYSLPIFDEARGKRVEVFYEVIHTNKRLALLSRHIFEYREKVLTSGGTTSNGMATTGQYLGTISIEKVYEELYFADKKGNIKLYCNAQKDKNRKYYYDFDEDIKNQQNNISKETSRTSAEIDKYKIQDNSTLRYFMTSKYIQVNQYIRDNKLKVNTLDEIVQVMDYYETLF